MSLYQNQLQYDQLAKAEMDLEQALWRWKDDGGSSVPVIQAINAMIDLRVQIARENNG
jgi:hypothetical protein